jgi:DNA-binding NtrC family response regulator
VARKKSIGKTNSTVVATGIPVQLNGEVFEAHVYTAKNRAKHESTVDIDSASELEQSGLRERLVPMLNKLAKEAKGAQRPSGYAHVFFSMLVGEWKLTSACLRQVVNNQLLFVHFECHKAKVEPRTFTIGQDTNIIVNAAKENIPVIDGDQTKNKDNHPVGGNLDDGSIFSFPYEDTLKTRWLFTTCAFSRPDAFSKGYAAVLKILFPVFCAHYNAIAFRHVANDFPHVLHGIDIHRNLGLKDRIQSIIKDIPYTNTFYMDGRLIEGTREIDETSIHFELYEGHWQNTGPEDRGAKELLLKIAHDNPHSSLVVSKQGTLLDFQSRDGAKFKSCNAPPNWPSERHVAIVPIDIGPNKVACVWIENDEQPIDLASFLEVDRQLDSLEADLRAAKLPARPDHGESVALEDFAELEDAARQPSEPVLIEGPHGTGKLYYARFIHRKLFRSSPSYTRITPLNAPKTVEELNLLLNRQESTVVVYRIDEIAPALQTEMLRLVDERILTDGSPLVAKLIFIMSSESLESESDSHNATVRGLRQRLRFSCVHVVTESLLKSPQRIPKLVKYLLDTPEMSRMGKKEVSDEVMQNLKDSGWPGNLPELTRILRIMVDNAGESSTLEIKHYPHWFKRPGGKSRIDLDYAKMCFELLDREGKVKYSTAKASAHIKALNPSDSRTATNTILTYAKSYAQEVLKLPAADAMRRLKLEKPPWVDKVNEARKTT